MRNIFNDHLITKIMYNLHYFLVYFNLAIIPIKMFTKIKALVQTRSSRIFTVTAVRGGGGNCKSIYSGEKFFENTKQLISLSPI